MLPLGAAILVALWLANVPGWIAPVFAFMWIAVWVLWTRAKIWAVKRTEER